MFPLAFGLCLFGGLPLRADPPALTELSTLSTPVSIVAPFYHYDASGETVRAEGGVEATFGDLRLNSAAVTLNLSEESVQAEGQVELTGPEFRLTGRDLKYALRLGSGSMSEASGEVAAGPLQKGNVPATNLRLKADEVLLYGSGLTLLRGRFTLCDAEKPHFWLGAGKLVVSPGESATLSSGSLWLYGHKVIHFPSYSVSFREGGRLPVPVVGYNKGWGAFTGLAAPLLGGRAEVAVSSTGGVVGKWAASGRLKEQPFPGSQWNAWEVTLARREDAQDPLNSSLLVDLFPSLSLDQSIGNLGRLRATYANVRELPTQVRREKAEVRWEGPEERIGQGRATLTLRPRAWHNGYSEGEEYRVLSLEAEAKARIGPGKSLAVTYVHNAVGGTTPFEYDDVDVKRELRPTGEWRIGRKWAVRLGGRYDLTGGGLVDDLVRVDAIQHCLTYSVEWREARGELNFSVGLSGEG